MPNLELNIKFVTWPNNLILNQTSDLSGLIKNRITGCYSGDFIGLAMMVYKPLYHALQTW